jgi:hypothetical protein
MSTCKEDRLDFSWSMVGKREPFAWLCEVRELMQEDVRISFGLYRAAVVELDRIEGQLSSEYEAEVYDMSGPDGPIAPCDGWQYEE